MSAATEYAFAPSERPTSPGSPYSTGPSHGPTVAVSRDRRDHRHIVHVRQRSHVGERRDDRRVDGAVRRRGEHPAGNLYRDERDRQSDPGQGKSPIRHPAGYGRRSGALCDGGLAPAGRAGPGIGNHRPGRQWRHRSRPGHALDILFAAGVSAQAASGGNGHRHRAAAAGNASRAHDTRRRAGNGRLARHAPDRDRRGAGRSGADIDGPPSAERPESGLQAAGPSHHRTGARRLSAALPGPRSGTPLLVDRRTMAGDRARRRDPTARRRRNHRKQPRQSAGQAGLDRQLGHAAFRRCRDVPEDSAGRTDLWYGRPADGGRTDQRSARPSLRVRRSRHGCGNCRRGADPVGETDSLAGHGGCRSSSPWAHGWTAARPR